MRIAVINPNTTQSMTDVIAAAAREAAGPGTEIAAITALSGPVSIEGHYDEAVAATGLLETIRAEGDRYDAYVIACFGDPGLRAMREIVRGPVLGIAEAAMQAATMVSTGFSVVTTLARTRSIAEHLVHSYGMDRFCRKVRATDIAVLDLDDPASNARSVILAECRQAIEQDGSSAIVLGCAGMADLARDLSGELAVPVIDGVAVAVRFCEALVGLGLKTSKHVDLAAPLPKRYTGTLSFLAP